MTFPIELNATLRSDNGNIARAITLRGGLTVLIGPNGSGKTHLLRAIKEAIRPQLEGKKVRFLSAGRMGMLEQNRSDYDGHRGSNILYEHARFGNKGDVDRRHSIETLNGDFQTLSVRADILIKVQERLKKLFKRDLIIEWDAGSLKVVFARLDNDSLPYSSGREASGLLHIVGILAALYDDEVGALMLDEPEVSLHPQLQAFLLNEIISSAGHYSEGGFKKIIVMATHSPEMINVLKCEDLISLIFCQDLEVSPVQIPPSAGELQNQKIQALVARLGQEHKLSLFCKRPLLVEGTSDALLCSFISRKLGLYLEAAGSQILPVFGTGQMPIVAKFMRLIGKKPVVLADADAFADGLDLTNYFLEGCREADQKAAKLGSASAQALATTVYNDFCQLVQRNWGDISELAMRHPYWVNKCENEDTKATRRSALCALFSSNESEIAGLKNGDKWQVMKTRVAVVLDILQLSGCFLLSRGTIESYYQSSDVFTSEGKPSAAVVEIAFLDDKPAEQVKSFFPEIVRCIEYASLGETINEAESLKDVLLSIAAPAMGKLNAGSSTKEMKILARTILREKAEIFDLIVEDGNLIIVINSQILNVTGFPIKLNPGDDVVKIIDGALQPRT